MRFVTEGNVEPVVKLELQVDNDNEGTVDLVGTGLNGTEWLVATFTNNGKFEPNKVGCRELGITIDTTYM